MYLKLLLSFFLCMLLSCTDDSAPRTSPENGSSSTPSLPTNKDYIGLTVKDAEALASSRNTPFRVIKKDGEPLMTTKDFRPGRINATVENGKVVSYQVEE